MHSHYRLRLILRAYISILKIHPLLDEEKVSGGVGPNPAKNFMARRACQSTIWLNCHCRLSACASPVSIIIGENPLLDLWLWLHRRI